MLVSGGGPAGCATAIGLARQGVPVVLVTGPARRSWIEGLSERTRKALLDAHCPRAAAAAGAESTRYVSWGSMEGSINREALTQRDVFDEALCDDAEAAGVTVLRDALLGAESERAPGWRFSLRHRGEAIRAARWVEARGRRGLGHRATFCGPPTLALALRFDAPRGESASALLAWKRGFAWIATTDGHGVLQCYADPQREAMSRSAIREHLGRCLRHLAKRKGPEWIRSCAGSLEPGGPIAARDATARLGGALVGPSWIRVGEAAAATDPLSGQGVFGALASASAALAVLRTQLAGSADDSVDARVERFYRGRIEGRFWREWEAGRAFYRDEGRFCESPFWKRRKRLKATPVPFAVPASTSGVRIATQSVVDCGRILERPVLVTPDHPDGVWRLDGVDLVALMRAPREARHHLAQRFDVDVEAIRRAQRFLARRDLTSCLTDAVPIHHSESS